MRNLIDLSEVENIHPISFLDNELSNFFNHKSICNIRFIVIIYPNLKDLVNKLVVKYSDCYMN